MDLDPVQTTYAVESLIFHCDINDINMTTRQCPHWNCVKRY